MNSFKIASMILIGVYASIAWTPCVAQVSGQSRVAEEPDTQLLELRIPSFLFTSAIDQSFQRDVPVDAIILETHTTGKACCVGRVSSELLDARGTAVIRITIRGKLDSQTASKRGPAIIHAESQTEYTAIKHLEVVQGQLKHSPTELQSTTSVVIGSIETTLPRWSGSIVRQVATKQAYSRHQEVVQVTDELTRSELMSNIEKEFETQIANINKRIDMQTAILHLISGRLFSVQLNSKKDAVEVAVRCKKSGE